MSDESSADVSQEELERLIEEWRTYEVENNWDEEIGKKRGMMKCASELEELLGDAE